MTAFLRAWTRKKLWIAVFIFAALYLAIHFFIFDDEKITSLQQFFAEAGGHFWHVFPIIVIFLIMLGKDAYDRREKRRAARSTQSDESMKVS